MQLLDNLLIEKELNEMTDKLKGLMANYINILQEGVTDLGTPPGDLAAAFDEASKRLAAAHQAWNILNSRGKFLRPEQRKEVRSRVTGNLNRLNGMLNRITKQAERDHLDTNTQTPQFNPQQQQQPQQQPRQQFTPQARPQGQPYRPSNQGEQPPR